MIALLEEEVRTSGYEYSADFLRIAARSLRQEVSLGNEMSAGGKTTLESVAVLQ